MTAWSDKNNPTKSWIRTQMGLGYFEGLVAHVQSHRLRRVREARASRSEPRGPKVWEMYYTWDVVHWKGPLATDIANGKESTLEAAFAAADAACRGQAAKLLDSKLELML